ncbi:alcohol dehydrogenase [Alicyclobacillus hesperidum subsp. aegles]|uniref:zinc-binding dehydrogenase n=1 Tax=Alicyclobacillus hesperidum TaxID=89784 RepID=UPI0007190D48|nr:zinc-binding dehydrogenase [Alicyclobacillus hesperidum]KRW90960.1 alcohol dehydrogenase [Alicyclobacillus tengchongensis]GLG01668.1 alcohol dehydrogenase [Alicyclobacillus hesperidum subsp. aegles]
MATMRAVQIAQRGGPLQLVELPIPEPGPEQVRIRVEACGVCHGEMVAIEGHHPHMVYPRIPGHEVIGVIDKLGDGVAGWHVGERVGVGWMGGHGEVTGLTQDGGYAEYMVAYIDGLARVPDGLEAKAAAPLMCAGNTVFTALRSSMARPGDLVAIGGIGGLGHLAVQYARKAGYRVAAVSRGRDKEELAKSLGADVYIDAKADDPGAVLRELGGARVALATAPNAASIRQLFEGLAPGGELIIVAGSGEPIDISAAEMLGGKRAMRGWTAGPAADSEATIQFSLLTNVVPMIETFPLERAQEALDKMLNADVRFRAVLSMA